MPRAIWALLLAGCAGAEAMTAPPAPPQLSHENKLGYFPGETMAYEVQLAGVLVGEAQLAVGAIGNVDGKPALVVKSRAATAGAAALVKHMVDESTTVIDVATGKPMQVDTLVVSGERTTTVSAKFTGTVADIKFQRSGEKLRTSKIDFKTEAVHDMHSAMAQLRGWRAVPGVTKSVYIIGGRLLWRIDLKYVGEETIGAKSGNRRAVVLEGTSFRARKDLKIVTNKPSRSFRVWLSDDADRVPLKCAAKTELGDIVMELVDYQRP
jgi:hypothetical protein